MSSQYKYRAKAKLAKNLTEFDAQWTELQNYCCSAKFDNKFKLLHAFGSVFESLEMKVIFFINRLPISIENYKDNLMTKEDLSYDRLYHWLLDITMKKIVNNKVYLSK